MMEIESQIEEIETKLSKGEVNDEILKSYADKKKMLEEITDQWDLAQTELDNTKKLYDSNN